MFFNASVKIICLYLKKKLFVSTYSSVLSYFHSWTPYSHSGIHTSTSCLPPNIVYPNYTGPFFFILVFTIPTPNNSFENGHPFLNYGAIIYLKCFSLLVTSFMPLWFLIFSLVFLKMLLFKIILCRSFIVCYLAGYKASSYRLVQI